MGSAAQGVVEAEANWDCVNGLAMAHAQNVQLYTGKQAVVETRQAEDRWAILAARIMIPFEFN